MNDRLKDFFMETDMLHCQDCGGFQETCTCYDEDGNPAVTPPKPVESPVVPPPSPQPQEATKSCPHAKSCIHPCDADECFLETIERPNSQSEVVHRAGEDVKAQGAVMLGIPSTPSTGMQEAWPMRVNAPTAILHALSDATPQEDTVAARSWHKVHGRPDVLGVRTLASGQREYLMHNEALSQPYYVEIEEVK